MHDSESNDAEKVKADQYAHTELSTIPKQNCSKMVCLFENIISFCDVQKILSQENASQSRAEDPNQHRNKQQKPGIFDFPRKRAKQHRNNAGRKTKYNG